MILDGFGLSSYRSFGDAIQLVGPCEKVTLLAGQNNSGKSNLLTFLHRHLEAAIQAAAGPQKLSLPRIDRHIGAKGPIHVSFGELINGDGYKELIGAHSSSSQIGEHLKKVLNSTALARGTELAWFTFEGPMQGGPLTPSPSLIEDIISEKVLEDHEWLRLWRALTGRQGGSLRHWVVETIPQLSPVRFLSTTPPKVALVPAIRRIGDPDTKPDDFSGVGIIDRLAQLERPGHFHQEQKAHFAEITEFLRTVLENDEATLEIPYERDNILVNMDGRVLPLSSLGTGIHEVVILAAAATVLRNQILCIEEPELHLHPLLQRKLIRYLQTKTTNQYFIATHSAHFLEAPSAAVFHVRHRDGVSAVEPATTPASRAAICADLGYRASDLVQANCVIWVEGPSDRIYLRHWLQSMDADLFEGIHYSIMFYGGRLLSHLTARDPEVTEFISLRRLNRYIAILIDSDKSSAQTRMNATKRRVAAEFEEGPGFGWVTRGREIENYVPDSLLEETLGALYPDFGKLGPRGPYQHALHYFRHGSRRLVSTADKVKVAHALARGSASLDVMDLKSRLKRLVAFIREANDM